MPELPEIFQYAAKVINPLAASSTTFDRVVFASSVKESSKFSVPKAPFVVKATTCGKQLQLELRSANGDGGGEVNVVVGFGLVGIFKKFASPQDLPSEMRFAFVSSSVCLALCDSMKMA